MSALRLVHYASKPLLAVHSVEQPSEPDVKPHGLWVSDDACEHNWREWCESEGFALQCLKVPHDIELADTARILRLSSCADIDAFTAEYGADLAGIKNYRIRWASVSTACDGILITPYIFERRLTDHARWYYGWDCASGCIWNASAIASIVPRENQVAA